MLLAAGGVALLMHLGHPERMFYAFTNPSAGITREGAATGLFGVLVLVDFTLGLRSTKPAPKALGIAAAIAGVLLLLAMGLRSLRSPSCRPSLPWWSRATRSTGNRSILYAGTSTSFGQIANCINAFGGGLASSSTESFGSCQYYSDPVIGTPLNGIGESNDRMDFVNADYIVMYGSNTAWASPGTYTYAFDEAKQAGVKFVYVGPEFNPTAAHFHAKWIRVRPGTDTALLLAAAYEMFKLDEAEGRDKDRVGNVGVNAEA